MKTFLKQYLTTWAKLLVLTPALVFSTLACFIHGLYSLYAAALLGDGEAYEVILDDVIDRVHL